MTTTFHISAEELNDEFLRKIKHALGRKQLLITVAEDDDDTFFLLSTEENKYKFKQSLMELKDRDLVSVTLGQLRK